MDKKTGHKRRLYRSLLATEVMARPELCQIYIYLLLRTAWKPCAFRTSSAAYRLSPGQAVWGKYSAARALGISPSAAWRRLHSLERTGMIRLMPRHDCTIVEVRDWDLQQTRNQGQTRVAEGWITISDDLLESRLIRQADQLHLYLTLCLQARPFPSDDGQLMPGQLPCTHGSVVASLIGTSVEKAALLIKDLTLSGYIRVENSRTRGTIITISGWETDQARPGRRFEEGSLVTDNGLAPDHHRTTGGLAPDQTRTGPEHININYKYII